MNRTDHHIDGGKAFDWGKASVDYAKYRDIYPQEFYDKILRRGLCISGQSVLDLRTGTGVLPRKMKAYRGIGASLTDDEVALWEQAHKALLEGSAPVEFDILHYGAIAELQKK